MKILNIDVAEGNIFTTFHISLVINLKQATIPRCNNEEMFLMNKIKDDYWMHKAIEQAHKAQQLGEIPKYLMLRINHC